MSSRRLLRAEKVFCHTRACTCNDTWRELLHGTQYGNAANGNQCNGFEGSHPPSALLIW